MSKEDFIGRDEIISKITELVDIMPADKNCCIALDGEWGSGKSFVMDRLKENFESKENNFVVFYDAWKNNFYSDPLIAILYCIFDTLQSKVDIKPKRTRKGYKTITIKDCDKEKTKKIVGLVDKAIKENGSKVSNEILNNLKDIGSAGAVLYYAISLIKGIIKQAKATILDNNLFAEFKSYQSLLEEAKATLNLITTGDTDKPSKLIILVDEIDRCLPNEQLVILERLHHLFDINNCAVIVALNKKAIVESYTKIYCNDKKTGEEYLRKFLDYEFVISKSEIVYLKNALEKLAVEINQKIDSKNIIEKEDIDTIVAFFRLAIVERKRNLDDNDNILINTREAEKFVSSLKALLKRIPIKDSDYDAILLWTACVGLYYKRYASSSYKDYFVPLNKSNGLTDLINLPEDLVNYDKSFKIDEGMSLLIGNKMKYCIYYNPLHNQIQYVINFYRFNKGVGTRFMLNSFVDIKRCGGRHDYSKEIAILKEVDKYGQ